MTLKEEATYTREATETEVTESRCCSHTINSRVNRNNPSNQTLNIVSNQRLNIISIDYFHDVDIHIEDVTRGKLRHSIYGALRHGSHLVADHFVDSISSDNSPDGFRFLGKFEAHLGRCSI